MTQTNKPPARLLADVGPILDELAREIEAAPLVGHAFDLGRVSTLRLTKGEAEK